MDDICQSPLCYDSNCVSTFDYEIKGQAQKGSPVVSHRIPARTTVTQSRSINYRAQQGRTNANVGHTESTRLTEQAKQGYSDSHEGQNNASNSKAKKGLHEGAVKNKDYKSDVNRPAQKGQQDEIKSGAKTQQGSSSKENEGRQGNSSSQMLCLKSPDTLLEDILQYCNHISVQEENQTNIKIMVSKHWPNTTPKARLEFPQFTNLYAEVKAKNLPNALGAKQYVQSDLVIQNWVALLQNYHDNELCHFLAYGWPLGFYAQVMPVSVDKNHPSALAYPQHIDDFLDTEMRFGAILGPIDDLPFTPWMRISPLMTRPKKDSNKRRVIVDLSYPEGQAVNTGINTTNYMGNDISYTLPTIADLIAKLQAEGQGALIWKADLARAYRQLRADPIDSPLLGIRHKGKVYVDRCPPFGCRSSSAACQRVANALVFIMAGKQHHCLAYLDDFAGCCKDPARANTAFKDFISLTAYLGLQLSHEKCVAPVTSLDWLGYHIDTEAMTISIPPQKLQEVVEECAQWLRRKRVKKSMIQSLVGKLSHLAGCVQHARKFLSRILSTLRSFGDKKWITINQEFIKDVRWFHLHAQHSNGINLYAPQLPCKIIECDSSLHGGGGNTDKWCYTWMYTDGYKERYPVIHQMEAINLLVAYRTLAHVDNGNPNNILILTDNSSSSFALMSGRTRDPVLASCARELWLEAAKFQDKITIEHRPGSSIPLADALSRMDTSLSKADYVRAAVARLNLTFVSPVLNDYVFFDDSL